MIGQDQKTYAAFLELVKTASERILMLDYDGTLAPFRVDRDQAFPYPGVAPLLAKIMSAGTWIVFISGRPVQEILRLSGIQPTPEIWGSHGLERLRANGHYEMTKLPESQQIGLSRAAKALEGCDNFPRGNMELKLGGVAAHWRGMEQTSIEQLRHEITQAWEPLLCKYALHVLNFDGGMEIRAIGRDKGSAVQDILRDAAEDAAAAYLGDDRTDEDAFQSLKGKGFSALVRSEYRDTAADIWLKPPEQLLEFLNDWLLACGGDA
jgi:trehalose 6-phosphate phosphatase